MEDEIESIVNEHGWYCANIFDAQIPFCYTIGLMTRLQHPELIAFSLDPKGAHFLFESVITLIKRGDRFDRERVRELIVGDDTHRIKIRRVHVTQHPIYLGFAMGHLTNHGRMGELEAVQLCWPDEHGDFPFDLNCNPRLNDLQPRLDIRLSASEIRQFMRDYGG
ncbi:MAG: DUF4262 domain-containing protein [Planctomycetes bacterium]|nr:DUF4262 domain-containing protein [Planctomycetota bacterium]